MKILNYLNGLLIIQLEKMDQIIIYSFFFQTEVAIFFSWFTLGYGDDGIFNQKGDVK